MKSKEGVFDSFIKEKEILLRYSKELIGWAVKAPLEGTVIKTEEDAYNIWVWFNLIVSKYQEQSELLDNILPGIIKPLLQCF